MGNVFDFKKVHVSSQLFVAKKWQPIKDLIGFFTLTNEERLEAGIIVRGEGRAEEDTVSTLSSPKES